MFQVVPPCGGHPGYFPLCIAAHEVSSRAPVWGASKKEGEQRMLELVSSRAPVWGASQNKPFFFFADGGFKSCPRVGGIAEQAVFLLR